VVVRLQGDPANPHQEVFSTRSPAQPNPIGLHRVELVTGNGTRMQVENLEATDGTPILDMKPRRAGASDC